MTLPFIFLFAALKTQLILCHATTKQAPLRKASPMKGQ